MINPWISRLWVLSAILVFAGSASAENVLLKSNGLGAAALGGLGLTVGAAALSDQPAWQGYPKGGGGIKFTDDASGSAPGDCAAANGGAVAKALKGETAEKSSIVPAHDGKIRLTDPGQPASGGAQVFDSKAIYGAGQSVSCARQ